MQEYGEHGTINMRKFYARRGIRLLPSAFLCIARLDRHLRPVRPRAARLGAPGRRGGGHLHLQPGASRSGLAFVDPVAAVAPFDRPVLVARGGGAVLPGHRRHGAGVPPHAGGWCSSRSASPWSRPSSACQRWIGNTGPWPGGPNNDSLVSRGLSLLWLSRYDSLMWGVGLAVVNAKLPDPLPKVWRRWLPRVGAVGSGRRERSRCCSASGFLRRDGSPRSASAVPVRPDVRRAPRDGYDGTFWIQFGYTVTAIAFAPAMLAMARIPEWWANRALSWKPLRFLGRMSYTMYVWHTLLYFIILRPPRPRSTCSVRSGGRRSWPAVAIVACLPIFYGVERRHAAGEAPLRQREGGPRPQHRQDGVDRRGAPRRRPDTDERRPSTDGASDRRGSADATAIRTPGDRAEDRHDDRVSRPVRLQGPQAGPVGSFDGLRGMGVCMLLVGHALFGYVESWVTIIDAFFVLSGFLITTLLIQEHRSTKTIDLKKFYQRRAIRLLPSVVAVRRGVAGHLDDRHPDRVREAQPALRRRRRAGGAHVHVPPVLPERAVHDRARGRSPTAPCGTSGRCRSRSGSTSPSPARCSSASSGGGSPSSA